MWMMCKEKKGWKDHDSVFIRESREIGYPVVVFLVKKIIWIMAYDIPVTNFTIF
jgi:hypothetical protein